VFNISCLFGWNTKEAFDVKEGMEWKTLEVSRSYHNTTPHDLRTLNLSIKHI